VTSTDETSEPEMTWDGLEVAAEDPRGSTVVVRRPAGDTFFEYLLLHRAHEGPDHDGDWAWTAPAGARQPGEVVYPAALRELAEEAGIIGVELLPVDLGRRQPWDGAGTWAVFVADVPAGTPVDLVDPEHDRYEWVPADEAAARVLPSWVAERSFGPAVRRPARRIGFRPMTYDDLPRLVEWRSRDHVTPWFPDRLADVAHARQRYGARIDGAAPVRMHVLEVDGRPSGYLQHYKVRDVEEYGDAVGDDEAVAIDYLVGEPELAGGGLGPQAIWQFIRHVVLVAHPDVPRVVASPDPANTRSIRALQKTGFTVGRLIELPDDNVELLCTFDVQHWLG
jgi:RimJ/RimL family protein N-acetyltransferase/8-oxo-dGTP pyrophosphatase MutT (NUDIX family)